MSGKFCYSNFAIKYGNDEASLQTMLPYYFDIDSSQYTPAPDTTSGTDKYMH